MKQLKPYQTVSKINHSKLIWREISQLDFFLNYVTLHLVNPNVFSCNRFYTLICHFIRYILLILDWTFFCLQNFQWNFIYTAANRKNSRLKVLRTALILCNIGKINLSSVVQLWPTCTQPVQNVVSVLLTALAPSVVFCFTVQSVVQRTAFWIF